MPGNDKAVSLTNLVREYQISDVTKPNPGMTKKYHCRLVKTNVIVGLDPTIFLVNFRFKLVNNLSA